MNGQARRIGIKSPAAAALLVVASLAAACGSAAPGGAASQAPSTSNSAAAPTGGATSAQPSEGLACSLVTKSEAERALGATFSQKSGSLIAGDAESSTCHYTATDFRSSLDILARIGTGQAGYDFNKGQLLADGGQPKDVAGLGDQAYAGLDRSLTYYLGVRKGDSFFELGLLNNKGVEDVARKLAMTALGRLR